MAAEAPVWVLLGQRTGDNNQLLRLAGELGVPFRTLDLEYNALYRVPPALLGASLATLNEQSRGRLRPPWPKLVLAIGNRSVPVARWIREQSGGAARLVRLGNPRLHPRHFDLVITTPQYGVPDAPNVVRLATGLSTAANREPTHEESEWLARLPRPHRLLLIGGHTFMWRLDSAAIAAAATALKQKPGGSVIAGSSARSSSKLLDAVGEALRGSDHGLVWSHFPRYPVLIFDADEIYVTADSVAMISDAVATGKPLGLVMPEKTLAGRFFYAASKLGAPIPIRDIRRFWREMQERGLAGTVQNPTAGSLDSDPVEIAVSAVRELLER